MWHALFQSQIIPAFIDWDSPLHAVFLDAIWFLVIWVGVMREGAKGWEGGMVGNKDGRTHILISNFKLKTLYSTVKAAVWSSTPFCLTVQRFLGKNNYHFVICILMTVNGNAKMATNIFSHNIFLWNVVLRAIS